LACDGFLGQVTAFGDLPFVVRLDELFNISHGFVDHVLHQWASGIPERGGLSLRFAQHGCYCWELDSSIRAMVWTLARTSGPVCCAKIGRIAAAIVSP